MAIQPIDLQTLYSQLENVSKGVAAQQQGAQLHSVLQNEDRSRKLQEQKKAIEEAKNQNESTLVRKREGNAKKNETTDQQKKDNEEMIPEETKSEVITDPGLGRHIDITG